MAKPMDTLRARLAVRRLFFDIETSPNIGTFWRPSHKTYLNHENISSERRILCVAWKWENSGVVHHAVDWDNDKSIIQELVGVLDQATEIVAHNGDKFDMRWVRGRALFHGIRMAPAYTTIDTLKHARRLFDLNSYRLVYLAQYLGLPQSKLKMEYADWLAVLAGDERKRKRMVRYCRRDVRVLESVFHRLCPYLKVVVPVVDNLARCAECGGENIYEAQRRLSAAGYWRVQVRCHDCGKCRTVPASRWDK